LKLRPCSKNIPETGLLIVGRAAALALTGILTLAAVVAGLAAAFAGAGILTGAGMFLDFGCFGGFLVLGGFGGFLSANSTDPTNAAHSSDAANPTDSTHAAYSTDPTNAADTSDSTYAARSIHSGDRAAQQPRKGCGNHKGILGNFHLSSPFTPVRLCKPTPECVRRQLAIYS
jgi:hypothetical protein